MAPSKHARRYRVRLDNVLMVNRDRATRIGGEAHRRYDICAPWIQRRGLSGFRKFMTPHVNTRQSAKTQTMGGVTHLAFDSSHFRTCRGYP